MGYLLGWKKNSIGYILPESHHETSTDLADRLLIDSLHALAFCYAFADILIGMDQYSPKQFTNSLKFIGNNSPLELLPCWVQKKQTILSFI
jgi:hypothetical protein